MIELHDQQTAPEGSKAILRAVDAANGFTPNLFRALANSPSTLKGFAAMLGENDGGTLSPVERQIVQLTASIENQGEYCVAGHSTFADRMGMPLETIMTIRDGVPLSDARYQGLVDFTRALVRRRGRVTDDEIAAFEAAGFGAEQTFEVITGIALKTVTNFVSSVFKQPLDVQFQAQIWSSDEDRTAKHPDGAVAA